MQSSDHAIVGAEPRSQTITNLTAVAPPFVPVHQHITNSTDQNGSLSGVLHFTNPDGLLDSLAGTVISVTTESILYLQNININQANASANQTIIDNQAAESDHPYWLEMPKMESFTDLFSLCCSTAVIFGGLVPYIPQYLKIRRSKNSDGFSTYVCLTLLIANILRIMFWFGHQFEAPLLIQSFVMITVMVVMMEICIRVRIKNPAYTISGRTRHLRENEPMAAGEASARRCKFWNWDDYLSYVGFISLFTLLIGSTTYFMKDNYFYTEGLGCLALFTESMLALPQLMRNFRKKSTEGMSVEMVVMWLSGDLYKTLYFVIRRSPVQFYVSSAIQVTVDILILCQVFWYRRPTATYRKLPQSN